MYYSAKTNNFSPTKRCHNERTWFNFLEQEAMSRLGSIFLNERAASVLIKALAVTNIIKHLEHHVLVPLPVLTNIHSHCFVTHLDSCLLNTYSDGHKYLLTTSVHNWLLNLRVHVSRLYKLLRHVEKLACVKCIYLEVGKRRKWVNDLLEF